MVNGHEEAVKLILEAARDKDMNALQDMLQLGYHPDRRTNLTPLHYAAELNFLNVLSLLLDFGADPQIKDGLGRVPTDLAITTEAKKLLNRRAYARANEAEVSPRRPPPPPQRSSFTKAADKPLQPPPPPPPDLRVLKSSTPTNLLTNVFVPISRSPRATSPAPTAQPKNMPVTGLRGSGLSQTSLNSFCDDASAEEKNSERSASVTKTLDTEMNLDSSKGAEQAGLISKYMQRQQIASQQRHVTTSGAPPLVLDGQRVSELIRNASLHGKVSDLRVILVCALGAKSTSLSRSVTPRDHGHSDGGHRVVCIDDKDEFGRTALILATIRGHIECIQLLIEIGDADCNSTYGTGISALHIAAGKGWQQIIKLLLSSGAKVDAVDNQGNTALHHACNAMKKECIVALIEGGCNTQIVNAAGKTAAEATRYDAARVQVAAAVLRRGW